MRKQKRGAGDSDNPAWTKAMFARARPAREMEPDLVAVRRASAAHRWKSRSSKSRCGSIPMSSAPIATPARLAETHARCVGEGGPQAVEAEGRVTQVEGNKLTVTFDHAGEKKVIDAFVTRG